MVISIFLERSLKEPMFFVTGDFYYHNAHDAMSIGLNIVDPGHNVEKVMKTGVAEQLSKMSMEKGFDVKYIASKIHTDPFTII